MSCHMSWSFPTDVIPPQFLLWLCGLWPLTSCSSFEILRKKNGWLGYCSGFGHNSVCFCSFSLKIAPQWSLLNLNTCRNMFISYSVSQQQKHHSKQWLLILNERLRDHRWLQFILRRTWMSGTNFMAIHPIGVETFHLKPEFWISWKC